MRRLATLLLVMSAAVGLLAPAALAHLMPAGHGTINVVDAKAYIVVSLPVSVFGDTGSVATIDDGVMTKAELELNRELLHSAIRDRLKLDVGGQPARFKTILLNLVTGYGYPDDRGAEVTMMIVAQLPNTVGLLSLHSQLWLGHDDPLKIQASMAGPDGHKRVDIGQLTADAPSYTFFAQPEKTRAAPQAAASSGIIHLQLAEALAPAGHLSAVPRLLLGSVRHGTSVQRSRGVEVEAPKAL